MCSGPGVLGWAQKPVEERAGDQDRGSGHRRDRGQAPSNREGVFMRPLVT